VPPERQIFRFDRSMAFGAGEAALLGQLCIQMAYPHTTAQMRAYVSGEDPALIELYPEFATFRDITFFCKAMMAPSADALPR
jgi:hypothetical protein